VRKKSLAHGFERRANAWGFRAEDRAFVKDGFPQACPSE